MNRLVIIVFIVLSTGTALRAQGKAEEQKLLEEANALFEEERFAEAYPLYSQLVSLNPNNAEYNFRFGTSALYAGVEKSKAVRHLTFARKRGCSDVRLFFYLGRAHHLNYDFQKAAEAYREYLAKLDKKTKDPLPAARNLEMCEQGSELLTNIRDVVVLEKTTAALEDFYRYYDLSEIGGRVLATPEQLLTRYDQKQELKSVMHFPGDALTIYFTSYGNKGEFGKDIYKADILPGGEFSDPEHLPEQINTPFDEDFAFMHPDGKTLYFASMGHNSMGGYDIFKSEINPATGTFGAPQNLDFAINTPDNDIFYVVDSLKETAYFASSRNSVQDELNVYKVMVQRLPVNLTFISGDYFAEMSGLGSEADITVFDELSGRELFTTKARTGNKGYILDLPKAGDYRVQVKAENSNVVHTGNFSVPNLGTSVALRQELRLIEESGQEQLVIINHFDEPLDADLASLAAEALRRKSGLEVNASEEMLAELKAQEGSLREELGMDRLASAAGFSADRSVEDIAEEMDDRASFEEQLAAKALTHADELMLLASDRREEAEQLAKEAALLKADANPDDQDRFIQVMREVQHKLDRAVQARDEAENAVAVAEQLTTDAFRLSKSAEAHRKGAATLNTAVQQNDAQNALPILEAFYEETKTSSEVTLPSAVRVRTNLEASNTEANEAIKDVEALEDELRSVERKIQVANDALAAARKRSEKEEISEELARLNAERITLNDEIDRKRTYGAQQGEELADLRIQAAFFGQTSEKTPRVDAKGYSPQKGESLRAAIRSTEARIDELLIRDEETLALLNDDYKATRNDITLLESIGPQAMAGDFELKPVSGLRNALERELLSIRESAVSAELKERTLILTELREVEQQLAFLRNVNTENLTDEEETVLRNEIAAASSYRDELTADAPETEVVAGADPAEAEVTREVFAGDVDWSVETAEPGKDTEVLAKQQEKQRLVAERLRDRLEKNAADILASDDAASIEALRKENDQLLRTLAFISAQQDAGGLRDTWEQDLSTVINEEADYTVRTQSQIQITETYIDALESVEDYKRGSLSDDELAALNEQIFEAKNRLEGYRSDLELSLATNDEPAAKDADSKTESAGTGESNSTADSTTSLELPKLLPPSDAALQRLADKQGDESERKEWVFSNIELRESAIDQVTDFEEKDRLQLEINRLNALATTYIEEELATKNTQPDPAEAKDSGDDSADANFPELSENDAEVSDANRELNTTGENDAKASDANIAPDASQQELIILAEKLRPIESRDIRTLENDPMLADVAAEISKVEGYQKANQAVEASREEIAGLEEELLNESSKTKQRKLDRKIEQAYFKKTDAEVRRATEWSKVLNRQWQENMRAIRETLASLDEETPGTEALREKVERSLNEAEQLRIEAARIREKAAPEIDEIKQAALHQDALAAELEAVAIQERMLLAMSEESTFLTLSEDEAKAVLNGTFGDDEMLADEAEAPDNSASDSAERIDSTSLSEMQEKAEVDAPERADRDALTDEELTRFENTDTDRVSDASGLADPKTDAEPSEASVSEEPTEEISQVSARVLEELAEFKPVADPELTVIKDAPESQAPTEPVEEWVASYDLQPEERKAIVRTESYSAYLERRSAYAETDALVSTLTDVRNAAVKDYNDLMKRASLLEQAVKASDDPAEREGLAEELKMVYRNAQVRYMEIEDAEERLDQAVEERDAQAENLQQSVAMLDAAAIVAEAKGNTAPEAKSAAPRDVEDYLFAYPSRVEQPIFAFTERPAYSDATPIPVNPVLPEGLIFKVQVGAFRNPIPQNHFEGFAPLAGETLANGITRYTAGVFLDYGIADQAKGEIRTRGYSDAFVVAFYNGKRIPLSEARAMDQQQLAAGSDTYAPVTYNSEIPAIGEKGTSDDSERNVASTASAVQEEETPQDEVPEYAEDWSRKRGAFYSVQIGVYSKVVPLEEIYNVADVHVQRTANGYFRYTSGAFERFAEAEERKAKMKAAGITDAFIVAFVDGVRTPVSTLRDAEGMYADAPVEDAPRMRVKVGAFSGEVPSKTALALLNLESKWNIYQTESNGTTTYWTRDLKSKAEAQRVIEEFRSYGVQSAELVTGD